MQISSIKNSLKNWFGGFVSRFCSGASKSWWIVLLIFSVFGLTDITGSTLFTESMTLNIILITAVGALKATVITALLALWGNRIWKILSVTGTVLYLLLCVVNGITYLIYDFGISHRLTIILLQTNPAEVRGFLPGLTANLLNFRIVTLSLITLAATSALAIAVRKLHNKAYLLISCSAGIIGAIVFSIACISVSGGRTSLFLTMRVAKYTIETRREKTELDKLLAQMKPLPDAGSVKSEQKAATVLMIIGESASRRHHSLYGYPLPTTPNLVAMRDSLFIFTDAISSATYTAGALERTLTLKPDDNVNGDWYEYPVLIDIFRQAGYTTYWLSNQDRYGVWANGSGAIAGNADHIRYTGNESGADLILTRYDNVLLPELSKALADSASRRFIALNLIGSHTEYKERYPSSEARFKAEDIISTLPRKWLTRKKAQTVAEYDNSIHYTDSLLGIMTRQIAALPEPAVMIYFSDHGENVYDDRDFLGRDELSAEVPFIIYLNPAYRRANPEMADMIRKALDKPLSTANLPYQLMTLTGTTYSRYDPQNDVLSPDFRPRHRYVNEKIWRYEHR